MKAIGIASLLMLVSAGAAEAGDWRLGSANSRLIVGYDQSSIRTTGNLRIVWTITVEPRSQTVAGVEFDYYLTRLVIDCFNETTDDLAAAYHMIGGSSPVHVYEDTRPARTDFPDTIGAGVSKKVCGQVEPGINISDSAEGFAIFARDYWRANEND